MYWSVFLVLVLVISYLMTWKISKRALKLLDDEEEINNIQKVNKRFCFIIFICIMSTNIYLFIS